jgi:2-keto-4-pentenoate hydratase/2-oxohepta-3-ene-1,7-dioic acid hydratase in catechol pathway
VNGQVRQQCNTKDLVFGFRKLIEYASSYYTLYPGDCFYSGTTSGVGPVKPGDVITVESPLIGSMNVPVRAHVLGQS